MALMGYSIGSAGDMDLILMRRLGKCGLADTEPIHLGMHIAARLRRGEGWLDTNAYMEQSREMQQRHR